MSLRELIGFASPNWMGRLDAALGDLYAGGLVIVGFLAATAMALWLAWRAARRLRRSRIAQGLVDSGGELVEADEIREGVSATVEAVAEPGRPRLDAVVREVRGKAVELGVVTGDLRPLPVGAPVQLTLATGTAALQFHASVVDRRAGGAAGVIYVSKPQWLVRVQRRQYFRVPIGVPTLISVIGPHKEEAVYRGTIEDLSAGGFRAAAPIRLTRESDICVRVPITDSRGTMFTARVLDSFPNPHRGPYRFIAQCEFTCISADTREMLVRYCFDQEKELLRRRHSEDRRAS